MSNPGADPIDPTTTVGLLRYEVGDIVGVPLSPAVPGQLDYGFVSDSFLSALLTAYVNSPSMALARALGSMATQMIAQAQDIQVDDIKIKTVAKAELMMKRAHDLEIGALVWDATKAFSVVPLTTATDYHFTPQGSPWPELAYAYGPGGVGQTGF